LGYKTRRPPGCSCRALQIPLSWFLPLLGYRRCLYSKVSYPTPVSSTDTLSKPDRRESEKPAGTYRENIEGEHCGALQLTKLLPSTYQTVILAAAPIQDAIDLARYLVDTTKGFIRFSVNRAKTVGGPVEIAAITKHEGFKWVQRKHFYSAEYNS
jgi:hypothetical protein